MYYSYKNCELYGDMNTEITKYVFKILMDDVNAYDNVCLDMQSIIDYGD